MHSITHADMNLHSDTNTTHTHTQKQSDIHNRFLLQAIGSQVLEHKVLIKLWVHRVTVDHCLEHHMLKMRQIS